MLSLYPKQTSTFICIIIHDPLFEILFVMQSNCYALLLKFYLSCLCLNLNDLNVHTLLHFYDQDYVSSMSPQKLLFYRLPTRGRV